MHNQRVHWCPIFRALLECPPDFDLDFQAALLRYHPADQPRVAAALHATAADGQIRTVRARRYTYTGRLIRISGTIEPIIVFGRIVGLRGSYQLDPHPRTRIQRRARDLTLALSCGERAILYRLRRITNAVPWLASPV